MAVAIFRNEASKNEILERFFSEGNDVRFEETVFTQIRPLIELHGVQSVAMSDRIIGCPHEDGIDYPNRQNLSPLPLLGKPGPLDRRNYSVEVGGGFRLASMSDFRCQD
jgi:hypothetical protein